MVDFTAEFSLKYGRLEPTIIITAADTREPEAGTACQRDQFLLGSIPITRQDAHDLITSFCDFFAGTFSGRT